MQILYHFTLLCSSHDDIMLMTKTNINVKKIHNIIKKNRDEIERDDEKNKNKNDRMKFNKNIKKFEIENFVRFFVIKNLF